MRESTLKQRVFDQLFHAIALVLLLDDSEMEDVAKGLEDPKNSGDVLDRQTMLAFASAVRTAKIGEGE
jgi:hypothetical protein